MITCRADFENNERERKNTFSTEIMRIVIVDTTLQGPLIGGAQTFLPFLIKGLYAKGHEVHLVANDKPDKRIEKQITESGAIMHSRLWKRNTLVEDAAPIFANWVNNLYPDIYLISVSADIGWVVLPYLDPAIATFTIGHSNKDAFYYPSRHYKNFLTETIGVSHEICRKYNFIAGIDKSKIHWIPYGIKPSVYLPDRMNTDVLKLIFVGRIEEVDKRISDVVAIIKKLEEKKINYQFRIIGDGSRFEQIKKELVTEIYNKKVHLTGWCKGDEVLNFLQQSDIFILTSSSEGFSISLIEAMANGCCPVVTDIPSGSVQLIKNEINGYLINVGDIDAFAIRILYLAEHHEALNKMRNAAWETGRNFSIDKMVDAYLDCFVKGIATLRSSPRKSDAHFPLIESCRSKYPRWLRILKIKSKALMKSAYLQV